LLVWKSLCWAGSLGSTWPCTGFLPSLFSDELGAPTLAGVPCEDGAASFRGAALEPVPAGRSFLPHAASKPRDNAATAIVVMRSPGRLERKG